MLIYLSAIVFCIHTVYWCIVSDLDAQSQCSLPLCVQLYLHTAHCEFKILNIQLGKLPPPPPGPHTQSSDILYLCEQAMLNLTGDGIYGAYIYCNCTLYTGRGHFHGGQALHGVLPSLAGGKWPGGCDLYCDGRSILPYCLAGLHRLPEQLSCELMAFLADVL